MAKNVKRKYTKQDLGKMKVSEETEIKLEETPPRYIRGRTPEVEEMITKVDGLIAKAKHGMAIIIPSEFKNKMQKHTKDAYPSKKFLYTKVTGNDSSVRVYIYDLKKPK